MLVLMDRILLACGGFRAACYNAISRYCNTISIKQMCKSIVSVYILILRNSSARFPQRIFRAFNSSISIKFVGGPCSPASRTTVAKFSPKCHNTSLFHILHYFQCVPVWQVRIIHFVSNPKSIVVLFL